MEASRLIERGENIRLTMSLQCLLLIPGASGFSDCLSLGCDLGLSYCLGLSACACADSPCCSRSIYLLGDICHGEVLVIRGGSSNLALTTSTGNGGDALSGGYTSWIRGGGMVEVEEELTELSKS
jgi:hypothetical protein